METKGKIRDRLGRDAGDRGGPVGILGLAVHLAKQIALEDGPSHGVARQEIAVVETPHHQRMGDRHHQRRVGAGDARYPFGAGFVGQVCPQRTHQDELAAAGPGARHGRALDMLADAAAGDHAVLEGHAAEGEHDVAVLGDLVPGDVALRQVLVVADDMRNENRGGAGAVAVDGADIAPQRGVQKAVELALRVVETSALAQP